MTKAVLLAMTIGLSLGPTAPGQPRRTKVDTTDLQRIESFLRRLQQAAIDHDRETVAGMVQYPLTVRAGALPVPVQDAAEFIEFYDTLFTPELRVALELTGLAHVGRPVPAYPVVTTPDGMSMAGGLLWARRSGEGFEIARVIVPPAADDGPRYAEPQRVLFRAGQQSAQLDGALMRYGVRSYVVWAEKQQLMRAEIDGFGGRDAILRVLDRYGRAVGFGRRSGSRRWSGRVPVSGEYRIQVVRVALDGDPALLYRLVVTLE